MANQVGDRQPAPVASLRRHELARWQAMVRAEAHLLHEVPGALLQQVANQEQNASAAETAIRRLLRDRRPWLRWIERPGRGAGGGSTILAALAGRVTVHAVFPDGRVLAEGVRLQHQVRSPVTERATLRVWSAATGEQVASYYEDAAWRLGALSPMGDHFVTYPTERFKDMSTHYEFSLWDAVSGAVVGAFAGGEPWAFSDDGRLFVAGTERGELCLRQAASGIELARWAGPFHEVADGTRRIARPAPPGLAPRRGCAFAAGGPWLLVNVEGDLCILAAETLVERSRWRQASFEDVSPDGRWLLVRSDAAIRLLAAASLEEIGRWEMPTSGRFSPDSRLLALLRPAGTTLIDVGSAAPIATLAGRGVAFAPDGQRLLHGPPAEIWDVRSRTAVAMLLDGAAIPSARHEIRFSPDGGRIAAFGSGGLRVWEASSGGLVVDAPEELARIRSIAFAADGRALLSGGEDGTLRLWPLPAGPVIRAAGAAPRRRRVVSHVAFAPDGELARGSEEDGVCGLSADGELRARRVAPRAAPFVVSRAGQDVCLCRAQGEVRFCVFSADGMRVLSATATGEAALWSTEHGRQPRPVRVYETGDLQTRCAAFSPDGALVATASLPSEVRLWSVPTRASFQGDWDLDPEGDFLKDALHDRPPLRIRSRALRGCGREPQGCAFSADGHLFAVGHRRGITIWAVHSGEVVAEFACHGGASAVAFDRARLLAVGSGAGHLWVYRHDGWSLACETYVSGGVSCLAWSREGQRLAVVAGGAVHVFAPTGFAG